MADSELRILVVDDNRSAADALARVLRKQGDQVTAVYDGATAIEHLQADPPDVILTDLKMEPVDGMQVLESARALRPPVEVIVFTAYGAVDVAVRAMRKGARDFLTKPVTVDQVGRRLDDLRQGEHDVVYTDDGKLPFIAHSIEAQRLLDELNKAAGVPSPVWVEGEIGCGRGYAARKLHEFGGKEEPYVVYDVARATEWPPDGTVLLANVDDLPDDLQRKLYRRLQYVPEGVRLLATAGTDGRRMVAEGRLRQELYYALAVVVVTVPPLRHRRADIVPLVQMSLRHFSERYSRTRPELTPTQIKRLEAHTWPGNIRELRNLAERAVVMGVGAFELEVIDAPPAGLPKLEPGFNLSNYLESVERQILVEALRKAEGDRNKAGKLLGVERNTLRYKLNKYGLLDR
ncbi:MAG: sigma-54-dependent Fis family transcriptional regulator [Deltaproteobacteria bacterium]|nr:sigma-54-dependent Fis family transcriptional regulator [Deltaproteobacteria bacterium]